MVLVMPAVPAAAPAPPISEELTVFGKAAALAAVSAALMGEMAPGAGVAVEVAD